MERLTKYICERAHGAEGVSENKLTGSYCRGQFEATALVERLSNIEDILGDDYDLDRLRELVEAAKAGKIMILPIKPGEYIYLISLDSEIVPCRVGNIAAEEWGTSFEGYVDGFGPYRTGPNEKVFFSREAAEDALAKEADHE